MKTARKMPSIKERKLQVATRILKITPKSFLGPNLKRKPTAKELSSSHSLPELRKALSIVEGALEERNR